MNDGGTDQERPGAPECYGCHRQIAFGETVFVVDINAEQFNADGTVSVLGATAVEVLCRSCASQRTELRVEQPFAELLEHFRD